MSESKEITIKEDLLPTISKIDNIINECMPAAITHSKSIRDALILAKGVSELRKIFLENEAIKATIEAMQDNPLGFLTDRSPGAVEDAKRKGKKLEPYTYEEVVDCVIEGLFNGYRITGKEMYIIAGNFYGGQKGKHRKIIETGGVSNFKFNTGSPGAVQKIGNNEYSEISAWAKWRMNGVEKSVGIDDSLTFRIRVNYGMGEDAIIGKALSKLFGRVLYHITGQMVQDEPDIIDITPTEKKSILDKIKDKTMDSSKTEPTTDEKEEDYDPVFYLSSLDTITDSEICAYSNVEDLGDLSPEHLDSLKVVSESIKSGKMTDKEFKKIAFERFEMRQKSNKNNLL